MCHRSSSPGATFSQGSYDVKFKGLGSARTSPISCLIMECYSSYCAPNCNRLIPTVGSITCAVPPGLNLTIHYLHLSSSTMDICTQRYFESIKQRNNII